jgi:hypothetical protein
VIFGLQKYRDIILSKHSPFIEQSLEMQEKTFPAPRDQGCQIFLGKNTKMGENLPNDHSDYQLTIQYTKRP